MIDTFDGLIRSFEKDFAEEIEKKVGPTLTKSKALLLNIIKNKTTGRRLKQEKTKLTKIFHSAYIQTMKLVDLYLADFSLDSYELMKKYIISRGDIKREAQFFNINKEAVEDSIKNFDEDYLQDDPLAEEKRKVRESLDKQIRAHYMQLNKESYALLNLSAHLGVAKDELKDLVKTYLARGLQGVLQSDEELKKIFGADVLEGKVALTDKNGKVRRYNLQSLLRSYMRNTFHEVQTKQTKQIADDYGFELLRISVHNTRTPICINYEGAIYAKDAEAAKATGFPVVRFLPPYHRGCIHVVLPESYDYLAAKGVVKQAKTFTRQLNKAGKKDDLTIVKESPPLVAGYKRPMERPTISVYRENKYKDKIKEINRKLKKEKDDAMKEKLLKMKNTTVERLKKHGVRVDGL